MASTLVKMPRGPLLQNDVCFLSFPELQTLDPAGLEIELIDTSHDENPLPARGLTVMPDISFANGDV
jgi:hypothetical protein